MARHHDGVHADPAENARGRRPAPCRGVSHSVTLRDDIPLRYTSGTVSRQRTPGLPLLPFESLRQGATRSPDGDDVLYRMISRAVGRQTPDHCPLYDMMYLNWRIEMSRNIYAVLSALIMIVVIVSMDLLFFRNRFWERLIANIGIVLVFIAFYLRFLKNP